MSHNSSHTLKPHSHPSINPNNSTNPQSHLPRQYRGIDTTPWWVHQQFYEQDYVEDVTYMCKTRHRREMDEMNRKRKVANEHDKVVRVAKKLNLKWHNA